MKRMLVLLCIFLLSTGKIQSHAVNPYWERIRSGLPNQIIVLHDLYEYQGEVVHVRTQIPRIWGMTDADVQARINEELARRVEQFAAELISLAQEAYSEFGEEMLRPFFLPYEGIVEYHVRFNRGGLLSLVINLYQFTGGAHGMTHLETINLDLTTGRLLAFNDLFPDADALEKLVQIINDRIAEDPYWFFIDEFDVSMFAEDQSFYFKDDHIVVVFGLYEIAPYAAGIQEFALPVW